MTATSSRVQSSRPDLQLKSTKICVMQILTYQVLTFQDLASPPPATPWPPHPRVPTQGAALENQEMPRHWHGPRMAWPQNAGALARAAPVCSALTRYAAPRFSLPPRILCIFDLLSRSCFLRAEKLPLGAQRSFLPRAQAGPGRGRELPRDLVVTDERLTKQSELR